jgi:hypothetical protein
MFVKSQNFGQWAIFGQSNSSTLPAAKIYLEVVLQRHKNPLEGKLEPSKGLAIDSVLILK